MPDPLAFRPQVKLCALGQCVIEAGSRRIGPDAKLRFAALVYLVISKGISVQREALAELLWPHASPPSRHHSLRHLLYVLRRTGIPLFMTHGHVAMPPDCAQLDYDLLLADSSRPIPQSVEFLPGYAPDFSQAFREWVDATRSVVHAKIRNVLLARTASHRNRGLWSEVEQSARACLQLDPLNEEATLSLAEAAALSGSKAAAVQILDRFVGELGVRDRELRVPAMVLRKRISERIPACYPTEPAGKFIARGEILETLTRAIAEARSGQGTSWCVWGPSGSGKSRLLSELANVAALGGLRALRMNCAASGGRFLSIAAHLTKALQDLPGALGCSPESRRILGCLEAASRPAPLPPGRDVRTCSKPFGAAVREAVHDLVDAVSDESSLFVALDDADCADGRTGTLVRDIVRQADMRRILVVVSSTTPPHYAPVRTLAISSVRVIRLASLSEGDSVALFNSVVQPAAGLPDLDRLRDALIVAEGNPRLIHELAAHWVANANLDRLPAAVVAAARNRLARLKPSATAVLRACSLLGEHATVSRLELVLRLPRAVLLSCLDTLDRGCLLEVRGGALQITHPIYAELTRSAVPPTQKAYLHRQIGLALSREEHCAESDSLTWDCADHLSQAGELPMAVAVIGRHARRFSCPRGGVDAVAVWERAAHKWAGVPRMVSLIQRELVLALRDGALWSRVNAVIGSAAHEDPASSADECAHDDLELAALEAAWKQHRSPRPLLKRAVKCAMWPYATPEHRAAAGVWALILAHNLSDKATAALVIKEVERLPNRLTRQQDRLAARMVYHTAFGTLSEGVAAAQQLVDSTQEEWRPALYCGALRQAAVPLLYTGQFVAARELLFESLVLAEQAGTAWAAVASARAIARTYFEQGDLSGAHDWLERVTALHEQVGGDPHGWQQLMLFRAQLALAQGRLDGNDLTLLPSAEYWSAVDSVRLQSMAHAVLVLAALRRGEDTPDSAQFILAFAAASSTGSQDFAALARYELEKVTRGTSCARALFDRYLRHERRESSPLPPFVARALS